MDCNVIHVAGTNGKGSVCSYVSSILMKAGYRVGRYVSPTLFDYRERIQINDKWISKADTAYWMSRVREADERMQAEGMEGASAFELETVMAFLYFKASRHVILLFWRQEWGKTGCHQCGAQAGIIGCSHLLVWII